MPAPERYVEWINSHLGFNPRSQANSNALSEFMVDDLCRASSTLKRLVGSDLLVTQRNASVSTSVTSRNIDLVLPGIPLRGMPEDPNDLPEALTILVVDYDGVHPAKLITGEPGPDVTSNSHYDKFIARLVEKYEDRFCA